MARITGCRQHVNWIVSERCNVMVTYEFSFALKPDDKHSRFWREQHSCNNPRTSPSTTHSAVEASWSGQGFHWDIAPTCTSTGNVLWRCFMVVSRCCPRLVKLYAAVLNHSFVIMDDNACAHRDAIVDDFLESEGISWIEWPAYSLELNPI